MMRLDTLPNKSQAMCPMCGHKIDGSTARRNNLIVFTPIASTPNRFHRQEYAEGLAGFHTWPLLHNSSIRLHPHGVINRSILFLRPQYGYASFSCVLVMVVRLTTFQVVGLMLDRFYVLHL